MSNRLTECRLLRASQELAACAPRLAHVRSCRAALACPAKADVNIARHAGIEARSKKPAAAGAGRAKGVSRGALTFELVQPLAILAFGGLHSAAHLLGEGATDESSDGMRLPARGLHDLGQGLASAFRQRIRQW